MGRIGEALRVARRRGGLIETRELAACGLTGGMVEREVGRGVLTRLVHGVYVTGADAISQEQLMWLARILGGETGRFSGRDALVLRDVMRPIEGRCAITTFGDRESRVVRTIAPMFETGLAGEIKLVRSQTVCGREIAAGTHPTVPVPRAFVDLAAHDGGELVRKAWREADFLQLLDVAAIELELTLGRAGSRLVGELLEKYPPRLSADDGEAVTPGEFLLAEALVSLGMPRPLLNAPVVLTGTTYLPDLLYSDLGYVCEVDGGVHESERRKREDRLRAAHLRAHGYIVDHVADDDVRADPMAAGRTVIGRIEALEHAGRGALRR